MTHTTEKQGAHQQNIRQTSSFYEKKAFSFIYGCVKTDLSVKRQKTSCLTLNMLVNSEGQAAVNNMQQDNH